MRTRVQRCVGMMFDDVHRDADKKKNPEFYKALQKLLDLVAPEGSL